MAWLDWVCSQRGSPTTGGPRSTVPVRKWLFARGISQRLAIGVLIAAGTSAHGQVQPVPAPLDALVFEGLLETHDPPGCRVTWLAALSDASIALAYFCGTSINAPINIVSASGSLIRSVPSGCVRTPFEIAQMTDDSIAWICRTSSLDDSLRIRRVGLDGSVLSDFPLAAGTMISSDVGVISAGPDDTILLLTLNEGLQRLTYDGVPLGTVASLGAQPDQLGSVRGFGIHRDRIAVAHQSNGLSFLSFFSSVGTFLGSTLVNNESVGRRKMVPFAGSFIFLHHNSSPSFAPQSRAVGQVLFNDASGFRSSPLLLPELQFSLSGFNFSIATSGHLYLAYFLPDLVSVKIAIFRLTYGTPSALVTSASGLPIVVTESVASRPSSTVVDIDYLIQDADSSVVSVRPLALVGGIESLANARVMRTFVEGTAANAGGNVPTGSVRRLSWDAATDLGSGSAFVDAAIHIAANDGRGLVDLAFVTLPANVPMAGDPELTVSTHVVGDRQLLAFWLWLVASDDPGIVFTGGEVRDASGPLTGQLLASGTNTTSAGREFAFGRLGVREATAAETQRARTGTTAGVQQYSPTRFYGIVPNRVNEIGVETGNTVGVHVVRLN